MMFCSLVIMSMSMCYYYLFGLILGLVVFFIYVMWIYFFWRDDFMPVDEFNIFLLILSFFLLNYS